MKSGGRTETDGTLLPRWAERSCTKLASTIAEPTSRKRMDIRKVPDRSGWRSAGRVTWPAYAPGATPAGKRANDTLLPKIRERIGPDRDYADAAIATFAAK